MRGLISPTIIRCIAKDPLWHDKFIQAFGGNGPFDCEGYDCFGYNEQGLDRAGNRANKYAYEKAYDEEDFEYDEGCHQFQNAWNKYAIMSVSPELFIPIKSCEIHDFQDELNGASIWDCEDGYFEING